MKNMLLNIKLKVRYVISYFEYYLPNKSKIIKSEKPKIFLMDVPTYTNLGDQAIAYSELKFIKDNVDGYEVVEVLGPVLKLHISLLKKYIKKEDILILIGGGNFGDEYQSIEDNRLNILDIFRNNKICIFPQTIYYNDNERGKIALKKMKAVLENRDNVLLITRENYSFEFAKQNFSCRIALCPDIVLYLSLLKNRKERKGVLLCLRSDKEKKLDYLNNIVEYLQKKSINYVITDTWLEKSFRFKYREKILKEKWNQFSEFKLVITDRLHGMIFSVITNTPCIVMPNYNHKIYSFYNTWFKDYDYVRFLDDSNFLSRDIEEMLNIDLEKIDFKNYKEQYLPILDFIKGDFENE